MIEKIIDWSAKNRFIVLTVYLLLTIGGIYTAYKLPVDAIPDLSENQVIVFTEWMGRSPEVVEQQLTFPLVSNLQGLAGIKAVRASSMFGMSFVFVIFEDKIDPYFARTRVQERLTTLQNSLPAGVKPTLGPDGSGVGHIFWYTVESKEHDLAALRTIQDWYVRYKLSAVDGVAEIASIGGYIRQYQVDIDPFKLKKYDLTINDVVSAVQKSNNEVGGKLLEVAGAEYFVRGQGYLNSKADLENAIIKSAQSGTPVYIRDVAVVQFGPDIRRGALEKDGKGEVVGGIVVMRQGENAREVISRVKAKIKEISPGLPAGVEIKTSYDRSILIDEAIDTLKKALWEAALVVSLLIAIFLFHFRSIIRVIIEIPVAVLMSFILMYVFNITANIMSLGGIILAVGVIVDSSIVLVENAYRNIAKAIAEKKELTSEEYKTISINSAKQVGRAIFFSELIILVSFLPVFLLSGQEGKLFHPLAYTKTFVMFSSAVVAITLIPVLMTFLMRGKFAGEEQNLVTGFFIKIYRPVIHWVLKYRKTALAINVIALLITIPMIMRTGSEFMPPLDEGSILFMPVTLPNASIEEVNRVLSIQDKIIKSIPEVEHVLGKTGRAETATDNAPLSMIETIILLKPQKEWRKGITKNDIIAEMDAKLQIPGVRNGWTQPIINRINMLATGVRTDIGLKIFGDNLDSLEYYAIQAEALLKQVPGASDVVAERNQSGYYLDIQIKKEIAARYGMNVVDLQDIIETAIGGQNLSLIIENRLRFPVRVRFMKEYRDNLEELQRLIIPVTVAGSSASAMSGSSMSQNGGVKKSSPMGSMTGESSSIQAETISESAYALLKSESGRKVYLPLSELATIQISEGPPMINSENGMPRSVVYLNARGRDMGSVVSDAKRLIENHLKLPTGYSYSWSGQYESKMHAQQTITLIMPIVFLLIFLLLFMTLKDFVESLVVMLSVPFALIGGMYAIYLYGYNFSVPVWVGFIALFGVAVETGVVMVVYLHEALDKRIRAAKNGERGAISKQDIYEATVEGSVLRLRPKIMTVATSMIGLIPVMWATGTGSDVMKPLTLPMIGGLFTSAVHVLIITPVLFAIMKEKALKKGKLKESEMADWMK